MSFHLFTGTDTYLVTPELRDAVNVACALEKPLLIRGEPGNARDSLYNAIRDMRAREAITVAFTPIPGSRIRELSAQFNIVLGFTPQG